MIEQKPFQTVNIESIFFFIFSFPEILALKCKQLILSHHLLLDHGFHAFLGIGTPHFFIVQTISDFNLNQRS